MDILKIISWVEGLANTRIGIQLVNTLRSRYRAGPIMRRPASICYRAVSVIKACSGHLLGENRLINRPYIKGTFRPDKSVITIFLSNFFDLSKFFLTDSQNLILLLVLVRTNYNLL